MPTRQPRNLPFASLGELFKGREAALDKLRAALLSAKPDSLAVRVISGLGGIGKTRLAIEYLGAREGLFDAPFRPLRRCGDARRGPRRASGRFSARSAGERGARGRGSQVSLGLNNLAELLQTTKPAGRG